MTNQNQETFLYTPAVKLPDASDFYLCFPAPYNIGMSALGYLTIFQKLDMIETVKPHRVFTDSTNIKPYKNSIISFSLSFETDFIGIFEILDKMKIPLNKAERTKECPIIIAGGPVATANPEPFADIFDAFVLGDGETSLIKVVNTVYENKERSKTEKLKKLSEIYSIYVPEFYDVQYKEDLTINKISSNKEFAQSVVSRMTENKIKEPLYSTILTSNTVFADTFLIEVERGCSQKCFFCITSKINNPVRYSSKEKIINTIDLGLKHTRKIGLLGALITDHPDIEDIFNYIYERHKEEPIKLTTSSLRADFISDNIAKILYECNQKQITISLEAGSERLRNKINKKLNDEDIFKCIETCLRNGIKKIKMYVMVGLPGETQEDILDLIAFTKKIKLQHPTMDITLSINSFIPKAHTAFERVGINCYQSNREKMDFVKKSLLNYAKVLKSSVNWDFIQAVISRGDRRLSPILISAYHYGHTIGAFNRAFKEYNSTDLTKEWFALSERKPLEVLPWSHIKC